MNRHWGSTMRSFPPIESSTRMDKHSRFALKHCDLCLAMEHICAYPGRETLSASLCLDRLERETGIEPATFSLARRCSTTEPLPQFSISNESTPFPFTTEPLPTIVRSLVIK